MSKVIRFITKKGSKAIGPYSTVSIYNGVAYLSGQSGIIPATG
jgi:enamine deaminase RidA (YjgF/YER057c/UK114 family)